MANASSVTAAIGIVKIAVGDIKVLGVDGVLRSVQVGDRVYLGETLQTAANSIVQVELKDGRLVDLGRDAKITLDNDLLAITYRDTLATYANASGSSFGPSQEQITTPSRTSEPTSPANNAPGAGGPEDGSGGTTVVVDQANSYGNVTPVTGVVPLEFAPLLFTPEIFPTPQTTLPLLPASIAGTPGNDTLHGNSANNVLIGGKGNDVLVGDLGADTFRWMKDDQGTAAAPAVDTVVGFTENSADKLDLQDLLQGEQATVDSLMNYLHFAKLGSDTIVDIKSTGTGAVDQRIILQGVDLAVNGAPAYNDSQIIGQLLAQGKLLVDTQATG